ncbi:MAG: N-acetylneuraminate synthase family protein, partial [Elusimicrobiota bacterium]
MPQPIVVAEIGCNHRGDMATAKELIVTAAAYCKADYVKFQKRCNKELLSPAEYDAPHPVPANSYGATYGEHREFLEFTPDQHRQLMAWCREQKIGYATSVWDVTSAREMFALRPEYLKIPSACNLNFALIDALCKEYAGDIHISFGMTTHAEEEEIVAFLEKRGAAKRAVVYSCTSGYPVPFEDICLLEIERLRKTFGGRVKSIAFSGHHLGIAADVAAVTLGASWIERHYTLDRTWKGTDHAASLEPDGLRRLCRDVRNVSKALTYKTREILPIEKVQRDKLKGNS